MGLSALEKVPVRMLSTGQRKRATLARLISSNSSIWLLDEPANGLDRDGLALLATAIARHRASGGALIAASHVALPIDAATTLTLGSA
jgi:heme exporter protein A